MYTLKNVNGKVKFLLRSGKDFVSNKMSISEAQYIIDHGERLKPEVKGYPINIDGEWHFEGKMVKASPAPKETAAKTSDEIREEKSE